MGWAQSFFTLLIVSSSGGTPTGLFIYNGAPAKGNLIAQLVAPGVSTDPYGNAVGAIANFGNWSAAGLLLRHFGIDQNGNTYLANASGLTVIFENSADGSELFYTSAGAGLGNLAASIAPAGGTDPSGNTYQTGITSYSASGLVQIASGVVRTATAAPLIQLDGPHNAVLVYDALAALRETIAPIATTDGLGNTVQAGFVAYNSNTAYVQLSGSAGLTLIYHAGSNNADAQIQQTGGGTSPDLQVGSGKVLSTDLPAVLQLLHAATGGTALGRLVSTALLLDELAAPGASSAGPVAFGDSTTGMLRWISDSTHGDSNNYATARRTVALTTGAITSTTAVTLATFSLNTGITYELMVWAVCTSNATAGAIDVRIAVGTATIATVDVSGVVSGGTTVPLVSHGTGLPVDCVSQTLAASGTVYVAQVRVVVTVSAAGTILVQGRETVAGDQWTLTSGKAELFPV